MSTAPQHLCIYENPSSVVQRFSLPSPTIILLIENANSKLLKKLQKCCKWIYLKHQVFVADEIYIGDLSVPFPYLKPNDLALMKSKFWLTDELSIYEMKNFAQIIPKISKYDIRELYIEKHDTNFSDFQFLTSSVNLKVVYIFESKIMDYENKVIPVQHILALIPNAVDIRIEKVYLDEEALKTYLNTERKVKFKRFQLLEMNRMLDPNLVMKFVKKNLMDDNPMLILNFDHATMGHDFGRADAIYPEILSILNEEMLKHFFNFLGFSWP